MTQLSKVVPALPDRDRRRVIASAALMASDKDGEALAAVRATCRMLAPHGIGPADLIAAALATRDRDPRQCQEPDPFGARRHRQEPQRYSHSSAQHQRLARMCLMQACYINEWQREFLTSIVRERSLTARQQQKLTDIVAKIDAKVKERSNDRDF